ncbi:MAG: UDP-N-acetylmuramoyl-L-alanyl-D-glutamate--2,6-diaminopimelate ligase [Armatimonadetes bacterium]|nr:UDP-N-acetylmuramoyl-L-alanyl-D-glutamate--2,6-diaminopimelate ligase [Armatimonadota bacterium]
MHNNSKLIRFQDIVSELEKSNLFLKIWNFKKDLFFSSIETDSRNCKSNSVFVCISGFKFDGHNFAENVEKNGTELIICERKLDSKKTQIIVKNSRKAAAILAKLFFDNPTKKFKLVGVTGTNGKSTITHLIENILRMNKRKVGLIGTLGYYINGNKFPLERTTPDIIELNRIFRKMVLEKVEFVIMEVSSHSLALERVFALHFDAAIFTNLTQEHLDFHKNLKDYADTKFKLFEYVAENSGIAFINIDDKFGLTYFNRLECEKYSLSFKKGYFTIQNINTDLNGTSFDLKFQEKTENYKTNLIGAFNAFNLASALAFIKICAPEISEKDVYKYLKQIHCISGRLDKIENNKNIGIYVDFAHTPDALKNVLSSISKIKKGRLICVFGAGGERDKTKRSQMLDASLKLADITILTNDNPRNEEPAKIFGDIIQNTDFMAPYWILPDRRIAIQTAISIARKDDIVLLAGKGHEKYQIIKDKKFEFNDANEARLTLKKRNIYSENALSIPIDILQLETIFNQKLGLNEDVIFYSVSTDSRTIKDNSIFFALKGENFDGHNYVEDVLKHPICVAVVNNNFKHDSKRLIRVDDTLAAYGKLAAKYKSLFNITTIAITGSVGKTTAKEYIFNILSDIAPTLKSFANENNLIGLPKTIFKLQPNHEFAIFELGSNQIGEIQKLADICNPDIGIITNIGASHLEFFKDEQGVFQEKISLFKRELKLKIFPGDDEKFGKFKGITFGRNPSNKYRISEVEPTSEITKFKLNEIEYQINTPFIKFVSNAVIAVALTTELGISNKQIRNGLNKQLQISLRMEICKSDKKTLLIDCYNANPDSMKAAIDFWDKYEPEKPHIAILGDMLELGLLTEKLHKDICEQMKNRKEKHVISVGNWSQNFNADIHFSTVEKLISSGIYTKFPQNCVILLKASHSISLEKILKRL